MGTITIILPQGPRVHQRFNPEMSEAIKSDIHITRILKKYYEDKLIEHALQLDRELSC